MWTGSFEKLFNCNDPAEEFSRMDITNNEGIYPAPIKLEIILQIKRLKTINP